MFFLIVCKRMANSDKAGQNVRRISENSLVVCGITKPGDIYFLN
jgi:hypothetical protein